MDGIMRIILTFVIFVELTVGYLANGFIVLVNCMDLVRRRKISSVDQILTALAISRIILLSIITNISVPMFYAGLLIGRRIKLFNFAWIFANHFCMWFGACLSLFYFLKIAKFSNYIFVYLGWRIKGVVSVVMLLSLLLLGLHIVLLNSHIDVWIESCKDNLMNCSSLKTTIEFYKFPLIVHCVFNSIPFTLSQSTFLLLIFSLLKHLKNMQGNVQGCRDASTRAHSRALSIMVTSFLLCTFFFLAFLLHLWKFHLVESYLYIRFCQVAGISFPSIHSCVLILGNTKVRQALISVFWWLWDRSKYVKHSCP